VGSVVAVGPAVQMLGWGLAGVDVRPAESSEQARAALADLAADCSLLIVAPTVAGALSGLPLPADTVVAVLP
jgi:vacuolar-type H+-ATPase subunit F/Vma7